MSDTNEICDASAVDSGRAPAADHAPGAALASRFAGQRCLVTGGLGFIGSNLALTLAAAGAAVTVVDSRMQGQGANPRNLDDSERPVDVVEADIGDRTRMEPLVAEADVVFNLAGQISHLDSMSDPLVDLDGNTRSHLQLLETLRALRSSAVIVHTSTRQIYGRPRYLPVDEDHPVQPVDVNGITQWAGEQLHLLYAKVHGLRACSLRLTNIYGPRLRLTADRQGVIGVFVRRALLGAPLRVYGDGAQRRELLYVDDAVEALLAAAVRSEATGRVLNISHHEALTLRQVAEEVVAAVGAGAVELVPWPAERETIDIGDFVSDCAAARAALGWRARTRFADGIRRTIEFYRERRGDYL